MTNWEDMERLWASIYSKDQLQIASEEHPVLLTEPPLNPRRNRERAAEVRQLPSLMMMFIHFPDLLRVVQRPGSVCLDAGRPQLVRDCINLLTGLSNHPRLRRYASGRTTGVVLDSGEGVTHAVPIYEGFAINHSLMRTDVAGRLVSGGF